ncbi:hypothetical protein ABPG77_003043 [Micractinium sp. CCAP 211/92]
MHPMHCYVAPRHHFLVHYCARCSRPRRAQEVSKRPTSVGTTLPRRWSSGPWWRRQSQQQELRRNREQHRMVLYNDQSLKQREEEARASTPVQWPGTTGGIGRLVGQIRDTQLEKQEMQLQQQHTLQHLSRKLDGLVLGGLAVLGFMLYNRRGGRRGGSGPA